MDTCSFMTGWLFGIVMLYIIAIMMGDDGGAGGAA